MATWETFRYGMKPHQQARRWVPTQTISGGKRGCIVFLHGGGWNEGNPYGFYAAGVGKSLFLDFIEPNEATTGEDVVVIAMWYGRSAYNEQGQPTDFPAWDNTTDYSGIQASEAPEDVSVVAHNSVVYRCIRANGPATAIFEPGVTASWESYWYVMPANDPSGALFAELTSGGGMMGSPNSVTNTEPAVNPTTPRHFGHGLQDVFDMLSFLGQDANRSSIGGNEFKQLNIDPAKVVLMGESAGGVFAAMGCYAEPEGYAEGGTPSGSHFYGRKPPIDPQACILEITPASLTYYPYNVLTAGHYCGINAPNTTTAQAYWHTQVLDPIKDSVSPYQTLLRTKRHKPTFLSYPTGTLSTDVPSTQTDGSHTYTGWPSAQVHAANEGRLIKEALEAAGETNIKFIHDANAPTENPPTSGVGLEQWNWLKDLWSYPLS